MRARPRHTKNSRRIECGTSQNSANLSYAPIALDHTGEVLYHIDPINHFLDTKISIFITYIYPIHWQGVKFRGSRPQIKISLLSAYHVSTTSFNIKITLPKKIYIFTV